MNFGRCVCHGMFFTQCSECNDDQPGHFFILFFSKWPLVQANTFQRKAIFLIGEQFISGLSDRKAKDLEQS